MGKELDSPFAGASKIIITSRTRPEGTPEETGLYYYGARYLDPKVSRWLSADPAMGDYLPSAPVNDEARRRNGNLPGMGGVFNYVNLHAYHYAGNNPVRYVDPDGREDETVQAALNDIMKNGTRMGEEISNEEFFNAIVDVVKTHDLMDKKWVNTKDERYVCTDFVKDTLSLIGRDPADYISGSVAGSILAFSDHLTTDEPEEGTHVFYKNSDDTSHTGFVYFDGKGGQRVLHNGASNDGTGIEKVNLRERIDRGSFNWWFGEKSTPNSVYYRRL
jgi:hypothetical protein